jgi:DNA-binding SARP family transcriptional activator
MRRAAPSGIGRSPDLTARTVHIDAFGPLAARVGGAPVALGPLKHRTVLALLLCHIGRELDSEALIDAVWEGRPPSSAASNLRSCILGLRRVLGADVVIGHGRPGYRLDEQRVTTDIARFRALGRAAGTETDAAARRRLLLEAEALRRDRPFTDVAHVAAVGVVADELDDSWLRVVEARVELDLERGWTGELVPELSALAAEHPYRERFAAQLMLALYRCGRQSEALAAYRRLTDTLARELGVAPGHWLRSLHRQILLQHPGLTSG